jgi:hypothetical protein
VIAIGEPRSARQAFDLTLGAATYSSQAAPASESLVRTAIAEEEFRLETFSAVDLMDLA